MRYDTMRYWIEEFEFLILPCNGEREGKGRGGESGIAYACKQHTHNRQTQFWADAAAAAAAAAHVPLLHLICVIVFCFPLLFVFSSLIIILFHHIFLVPREASNIDYRTQISIRWQARASLSIRNLNFQSDAQWKRRRRRRKKGKIICGGAGGGRGWGARCCSGIGRLSHFAAAAAAAAAAAGLVAARTYQYRRARCNYNPSTVQHSTAVLHDARPRCFCYTARLQ